MPLDINRYNTKVRKAISAKYVEYGKQQGQLEQKLMDVITRLADKSILHTEYEYLTKLKCSYEHQIQDLNIKIAAFDEAREICLDIADEEDKG